MSPQSQIIVRAVGGPRKCETCGKMHQDLLEQADFVHHVVLELWEESPTERSARWNATRLSAHARGKNFPRHQRHNLLVLLMAVRRSRTTNQEWQ